MIYFTADTHFCHANIIHLTKRPFADIAVMNKQLIKNWNACVSDSDEIYILGDFIFGGTGQDANRILQELNGKKYLIRGNHDKILQDPDFDRSAFEWVKDYYVLNDHKQKFVLFHYPILEWAGFFGNSIHLYGHVHNSTKDPKQADRFQILGPRAFNVGVDVNGFRPVSIKNIVKAVERSER